MNGGKATFFLNGNNYVCIYDRIDQIRALHAQYVQSPVFLSVLVDHVLFYPWLPSILSSFLACCDIIAALIAGATLLGRTPGLTPT
jgi:hypothetical protein